MELVQKFVTSDGKQFDTKAEAVDYLRKPQITAALNKANGNNKELTDWLYANQEAVETVFESTKIKRVTKAERNQLAKALEAIKTAGDRAFNFVADNADAVLASFRWPSVERKTDEEEAAAIRAGFMKLTGDNKELTDWLIGNKDALAEAFEAGVMKRPVSPVAEAGLAAYRAEQAAKKVELEAAIAEDKAASVEGQAPVTVKQDAVRAKHKAMAEAAAKAKAEKLAAEKAAKTKVTTVS